jgi:hypothetical protein
MSTGGSRHRDVPTAVREIKGGTASERDLRRGEAAR